MTLEVGGQIDASSSQDDLTATTRAFGALATRLTEALGRARRALEPHAELLPDGTLSELDALLAEFARRRVRVALYGEVKAGKSTLLNAIAGTLLSPVAFDPLTSIPVRVTYGESTAWRIGERRLDSAAELERVMRDGITDQRVADPSAAAREVVVETDLDLLELGGQVDLLDTPGVGSAAQFDAVSAAALRSLDAVVLVVRYPALFTQFTRRLIDGLQTDVGKLFVVWNLDAGCAELTPAERARHAETLHAQVAGAHELFLVDARAGFRAMQADDGAGSIASGLTTLIAALRRFASSGGREVAALREAAKRTHQSLGAAHRSLTERHTALERALADARERVQAVRAAADAESAAARGQLADFAAAAARVGQEADATAAKLAADLRRQLRSARRRWVHRGDFGALQEAMATATSCYADAVEAANQATAQSLRAEAAAFGTAVRAMPRARTEPSVVLLAPEARIPRATSGHGQLLRRAVWHRWYLPGLAALEREGIAEDLASQAAWFDVASQAVRDAAGATLASRLAEITRRADAEIRQIKAETNFTANEAELERLRNNAPVVATQCDSAARISTQARALL